MSYIDNGIHYGYRTYQAGFQSQQYFSAIVRKAPKTYGKHTAFGKRTVLKKIGQTEIGKFPTKQDAVWAAKEWLRMRFGGGR